MKAENACVKCRWFSPTILFQTCTHEHSKYQYEARVEFHTTQHMRSSSGSCGALGRLFEERNDG